MLPVISQARRTETETASLKIIAGPNEHLAFWQHLNASGLLPAAMDGITNTPGSGLPKTPYANGGIVAAQHSELGLVFELTGFQGTTGGYAVVSPEDALSLDERYDDGNPSTGMIRAEDGTDTASLCVSGDTYVTATRVAACRLIFSAEAIADQSVDAALASCGSSMAGETRIGGTACPTGYTGYYLETCQNDGSWQVTHNYCSPVNCGGGIYGDTRTLSCPPDYTGNLTQQCTELGWQTINNTCVIDTSRSCTDGQSRTLSCPDGGDGEVVEYCSMGAWVTESNTCNAVACAASGSCPSGNEGDTCLVSCTTISGYISGDMTKLCTQNGTWEAISNTCVTDDGACTTGATQTISCPDGENGSIEQECVASNWETTSDSCAANSCGGANIGDTRESIHECPSGTGGAVYDVCLETGQWEPNYNNCGQVTCSSNAGGTDGNATWPPAAAGSTNVTGTCQAGFNGTPARDCGIDGQWDTPSAVCYTTCDTGETGGTDHAIDGSPTEIKLITGTFGTSGWIGCLINN